LKPIFEIKPKIVGEAIIGDVGKVSKEERSVDWRNQSYATILNEGEEKVFKLNPADGPFSVNLIDFLKKSGMTQGYILCDKGILNDLKCSFFMTNHKPIATFAEAFFQRIHKVLNISGFFLSIKTSDKDQSMDIVPHLHITFKDIKGRILGGHLIEAASGDLECKIIPLIGRTLKREMNPITGVMHIRTERGYKEKSEVGNSLIFALVPGNDFPAEVFQILSEKKVREGRVIFSVGTLWNSSITNEKGEWNLNPEDGLEVTYAEGFFSEENGHFSHDLDTQLVDKFGKSSRGTIISGEVKDLIEGLIKIKK
jgi:predicted DNA-binding protein with PD1-like motif